MFFKISTLKKLLKQAYKTSGLTVGQDQDGYYIFGGYWGVWINAEFLTKETKAAVIELCGDLPEEGQLFKAIKGEAPQYEIEQKELFALPLIFKECSQNYKVTCLLERQDETLAHFLQDEDSGQVRAVNEIFMELIDKKAIDSKKGETEPVGPKTLIGSKAFYWGNNVCYLAAYEREAKEEDEKMWETLSAMKINS